VLSAEDPVRAFQNFATLDLLSRGRAEIIVGRGSSIEAFPLSGFERAVTSFVGTKLGAERYQPRLRL
jgi:alkanesulfonate monooxygenase SsuD/methylene tetrahydromethanopterin reductase-like flavin-dependent oxidoreductase (luciferase family)